MAEQKDNEKDKVNQAVREIAETEAGQVFFKWLMLSCYYQKSTIVGDPQSHEVNVYGTLFNESRRRVYLDVRRAIPAAILRKIEN